MLEMKRTHRTTSHSSIPPCDAGPFPRAYGLFPSDFKGSFITNKVLHVLSAPCVLHVAPITGGGDKWIPLLRKGLPHCEIHLPLLCIA